MPCFVLYKVGRKSLRIQISNPHFFQMNDEVNAIEWKQGTPIIAIVISVILLHFINGQQYVIE